MDGIHSWHAHVYYDPATKPLAEALREEIGARFTTRLGRWHDALVGPHPQSMYQVAFENDVFPELVPFMALHRRGLTILVHPETGNELKDHRDHAMWMGAVLPLDLSVLKDGHN